ncbi:histidine kinase [Paenibacillus sp. B1-35]|uniref:histidine kinase n=2 Tax=Paenibacillus TaxID=44249 RepID=UPI003D2B92F0
MNEGDEYRRQSPEMILRMLEQMKRGRLRILMAVASGAGKTTQLLLEGWNCTKQGLDVVYGTALPTQEIWSEVGLDAGGEEPPLKAIAMIAWQKDGLHRYDIDVEAITARMPDVVLIDGLAHRNRMAALRPTRLEDVRELLRRGISVIATMNAYEDESVQAAAKKMTGVVSEWTVPSEVLKEADEVRLLDVSAESLMERRTYGQLRGKGHSRKHRAEERSRISILRELALRTMADHVNGSLEQHRNELGLMGPSGASERILVLAQFGWNGSIYVRRGQQIAKRLNGELYIVTFVQPDMELTTEQAAFRRSLKKMAMKTEAVWEEIPSRSRRDMAAALAEYAKIHGITRFVLGHSRQTRWQEWWNGSLIGALLRRIETTDLFLIADHSLVKGERILPARLAASAEAEPLFKRVTEQRIQEKAAGLKRGRLKVIIGAAPGVGKTYHMLQEGNRLLEQGVDVVIGLLETHGRAETASQVGALTIVPRKRIAYNGKMLEEMDTEELLRIHAEVVLVDELAHTNVPGSMRAKRYEDVLCLLEAGISVVTTVNVQHLESLNDAVEHLTGVRVRETVPDIVLRQAREIQLIDVTPQTIQERMRAGLIYKADKVEQALSNFFRVPNLIGLRELALREVADDVDERLESWERRALFRGPWRRQEVIFVCIGPDVRPEGLVRHGFRIAHRLKAPMHVVHLPVAPWGQRKISVVLEREMSEVRALTERLGGTFHERAAVTRGKWAESAVQMADQLRASQIIVGMPIRSRRWGRLGAMEALMRQARHMDVLVLSEWEDLRTK